MTLVEVLLAMVILATGAMVLMTAVSRCLAVIRISRNYHTARHVFDLGELKYPITMKDNTLYNIDLDPIDVDRDSKGFTFSRTSEKDENHKGMLIIKTRVQWADRGNQIGEEVTSYLYKTNNPEGF